MPITRSLRTSRLAAAMRQPRATRRCATSSRSSRWLSVAILVASIVGGCGCRHWAAAESPPRVRGTADRSVAGWEGFFRPAAVDDDWLVKRGIPLESTVVHAHLSRVVKLVLDDGRRQATADDLDVMARRYCVDPAIRAWNEDRCSALEDRRCDGDLCHYQHFGNCSGVLLGNQTMLTAAHCVDGMLDHPERKAGSVVLVPGLNGLPLGRLPLGRIVTGKLDFDHDWVVVGSEKDPVDVAAVSVEDGGLERLEVAQLPRIGGIVFIAGYPRVERRREADRQAAGYDLVFGTQTLGFGRVADRNLDDHPLCNVDGRQEHWTLTSPCPSATVRVEDRETWTGVITGSPFLVTFDSCNGYSGAPVFDSEGRLVGINVTLASATDPQERFDPAARMVAIPATRAMARLGLR